MIRFFTIKLDLWYVILLFLLFAVFGVFATIYFGYLVMIASNERKSFTKTDRQVLAIARIPTELLGPWEQYKQGRDPFQPQKYRFNEFKGLRVIDGDFVDDGVLLISAYSEEHGQGIVYLFDLQTQEILHEWIPPLEEWFEAMGRPYSLNATHQRVAHPYLLENGDILGLTGFALGRFSPCNDVVWARSKTYHHSIERGVDGDFYVPTQPPWGRKLAEPGRFDFRFFDQGYDRLTEDGEVVESHSIADILMENGYRGLLFGVDSWTQDRIHLNDVEPMHVTDEFVQEGDVALSLRNLSAVLLYRPSTGKVIWLQVGPWLWQHDVDYQGDGVFTIYGNDALVSGFRSYQGYNTIYTYDMKANEPGILKELNDPQINSVTNGLHRVLPNGDIFVEETWVPGRQVRSLMHRVGPDGLRWSFVQTLDDEWAGQLKWSRYLTREEADFPWLDNLNCEAQTAAR